MSNISPERVGIINSFEFRHPGGGSACGEGTSGGDGGKKCDEMTGIIGRVKLAGSTVSQSRKGGQETKAACQSLHLGRPRSVVASKLPLA